MAIYRNNLDDTMTDARVFHARTNPLVFPEVDEPFASIVKREPTVESALRFACGLGVDHSLDATIARYREISSEPTPLNFAPADPRLDDKLVAPLRAAKASYMLGSPMATVALAGSVSEMIAVLLWEVAEVTVNGSPLDENAEKALFGSSFEKLGQERRESVLKAYGLSTSEMSTDFHTIRTLRRRYLHLWQQDHKDLAADAVKCYHAAVRLAVASIGQVADGGVVSLSGPMLKYLERAGRLEDFTGDEVLTPQA
jgi:hypothetical protein